MLYTLFIQLILPVVLSAAEPISVRDEVDARLAASFAARSQVGVIIGLSRAGQSEFWTYGEAVRGTGVAPTADTFFEIGSISKTFTATLLALEVVRGTLRLDTQVRELWPDLAGTAAGALTLQGLATHHSGLPRMPSNFHPANAQQPYRDYTVAMLLAGLQLFTPPHPQPYPFEYSNWGMGLLGYILSERLHGITFGAYLQRELLSPLGLFDTHLELDVNAQARAAQGYDGFFRLTPMWDMQLMAPAGGIKATARDLLRWAELNRVPPLGELGAAMRLAQTVFDAADPATWSIGLGWFHRNYGGPVLSHNGATGAFNSNLVFSRDRELSAIMLANTDMPPACSLAPIFSVPCSLREWAAIPPEKLAVHVGLYQAASSHEAVEVFLQEGALGFRVDGFQIRLWPVSENEFQLPMIGAVVRFSGNMLVVQEGGQSTEYRRLPVLSP